MGVTTPIPGTFEHGQPPPTIIARRAPDAAKAWARERGLKGLVTFAMGECRVSRFIDPADGLTLVVSHAARYPTWDELKAARYRLLPLDRAFGFVLPPPGEYVDDPANPHVFELHEITN